MIDIIFLGIGITSFASFILWANVVRFSLKTFTKIKEEMPDVYQRILAKREISWLERKSYSPIDIGIQLRLYKAMYVGEVRHLMGAKSWHWYVRIIRLLFFTLILFFVLVAFFLIFGFF